MVNEQTQAPDRCDALREMVRQAFPTEPYDGKVTRYDPGPWAEELDEEQALYETLKGRCWPDIPADFVRNYPDAFCLLTPEALAVFFPAWLMYSLENMQGENEVRELLIYTFAPPGHSWQHLQPLTSQQRSAVRALIAEFADNEANAFVRAHAAKALARVDELLRAGQYVPYGG